MILKGITDWLLESTVLFLRSETIIVSIHDEQTPEDGTFSHLLEYLQRKR